MGMYRSDDGKGWFHLNTGRRASPAACAAPRLPRDDPKFGEKCGRMSDKVCDAPAGRDLAGKPLTCDMPLCEKHATPRRRQGSRLLPQACGPRPATAPVVTLVSRAQARRGGKTALMWLWLKLRAKERGEAILCCDCRRPHEGPPKFGRCECGSYLFGVGFHDSPQAALDFNKEP